MKRSTAAAPWSARPWNNAIRETALDPATALERAVSILGLDAEDPTTLPFFGGDATAGSENELQVAVRGRRDAVDLPLSILRSSVFANLEQRAERAPGWRRTWRQLERYLGEQGEPVWENSWVRLPETSLHPFAQQVMRRDLQAQPESAVQRTDGARFQVPDAPGWLRLPISYLLKLSLADALGRDAASSAPLRRTGERLMGHFLDDNTSPETSSFHIVGLDAERGGGRELARETATRYLFTHCLVAYANRQLILAEHFAAGEDDWSLSEAS